MGVALWSGPFRTRICGPNARTDSTSHPPSSHILVELAVGTTKHALRDRERQSTRGGKRTRERDSERRKGRAPNNAALQQQQGRVSAAVSSRVNTVPFEADMCVWHTPFDPWPCRSTTPPTQPPLPVVHHVTLLDYTRCGRGPAGERKPPSADPISPRSLRIPHVE